MGKEKDGLPVYKLAMEDLASADLESMKQDGTMKKILGIFYLEYDEDEVTPP